MASGEQTIYVSNIIIPWLQLQLYDENQYLIQWILNRVWENEKHSTKYITIAATYNFLHIPFNVPIFHIYIITSHL